MKVIKRDGVTLQDISFDKILNRIKNLAGDPQLGKINIEADEIAMEVIKNFHDRVTSQELDELAARLAAAKTTEHPDYSVLASRIIISNHQKNTSDCFSDVIEELYANKTRGEHCPLVSKEILEIVRKNTYFLNKSINYLRDYDIDFFGFKTLERSYLLKIADDASDKYKIVERPQHLWMRVALGIHKEDIDSAVKTYDLMSTFYFIHASPTLFNSGTVVPQMSSCFLLDMGDSIEGIFKCLGDMGRISKTAGGIGLSMSNIRANGSYIRGTNGKSDGIVKILKVINESLRFVNQGGRRPGSCAVFLEPWHDDIFEFLELRKNSGDENLRARDLFYALWVCDLFMERVEAGGDWFLMCPNECKGLTDVYGTEFENLYNSYVSKGKYRRKIKAVELWNKILVTQIETGMPYLSNKDSVNKKTNHKNLGTIKCSNLCNEILIKSSTEEYGTCNIGTIGLAQYVEKKLDGTPIFNFQKLFEVAKIVTCNLNRVIDYNYYPTQETEDSNLRHRPIAVGVQGLANCFFKMRIPFESEEAKELNKKIFETIYFGCVTESNRLAKEYGTYDSFEGSPFSEGKFQFDLWPSGTDKLSGMWDWDSLRESVIKHGMYNSLLTALPPTASTSQILGNYESFEPVTNNLFMRSTLGGDFPIVNKYLIEDLMSLGLWNKRMKEKIIYYGGSVQGIAEIPDNIKKLYKTIWEISQRTLIDLSADRGVFIDHTQSLNIYMAEPTLAKLTSCHFHSWRSGLKTSLYYLRTRSKASNEKFSIDPELQKEESLICSIENKDACMACSG